MYGHWTRHQFNHLIFLTMISKVLFIYITQRFTNSLLVLLTAFLDLPWDVIRSVARFRAIACTYPSLWDRDTEPQVLAPLPVTSVRLLMMSRMNSMLFPLHTPPYSVSSQEIWVLILRGESTGCFYFFAPATTNSIFYYDMNELLVCLSRLAVACFDWRPFLVNLVA